MDVRRWILDGDFGGICPGQTTTEVAAALPAPDSVNDMGARMAIWLYGSLELHFSDDRLFMIWSEDLDPARFGGAIDLDPWILSSADTRDANSVLTTLIDERAEMQISYRMPESLLLHVNRSGVTLWFENDASAPSGRILNAVEWTLPDHRRRA